MENFNKLPLPVVLLRVWAQRAAQALIVEEVEEVVADKIKIEVHSISRISTVNFTDTDAVISISSPGNLPFVNFPESTLILCFSDIERPYKLLSIGERFALLGAFLWRPIKVVCEMYWRRREEVKQALVPFRVSQVVCIERFIRALPGCSTISGSNCS